MRSGRDGVAGGLFVLSAPSGAGKTTISRRLQQDGAICVSVSHTTRPPRPTEKNGESYFFVGRGEFEALRTADGFLEWADVYGNLYGTSAAWVNAQLAAGRNVLLEIDCQGARQVKAKRPETTAIFVAPPSMESLRQRLIARGEDEESVIARRLNAAAAEMAQQHYFDYVIINDDLETAVRRILAIVGGKEAKNGKNHG